MVTFFFICLDEANVCETNFTVDTDRGFVFREILNYVSELIEINVNK